MLECVLHSWKQEAAFEVHPIVESAKESNAFLQSRFSNRPVDQIFQPSPNPLFQSSEINRRDRKRIQNTVEATQNSLVGVDQCAVEIEDERVEARHVISVGRETSSWKDPSASSA